LKESDDAAPQQSSQSEKLQNIVVKESNENLQQEPGDQDRPPKSLPVRRPSTTWYIPKDKDQPPIPQSAEGDLKSPTTWHLSSYKAPNARRTIKNPSQETVKSDHHYKDSEREAMEIQLDRRERELERQERELDRRSREIDRRERELERRQREFDRDSARWTTEINTTPQWTTAIEALKNKIDAIVIKERMNSEQRESELEARVMRKVNEALEREHQIMQMSDHEVNEMIEDTVGYLLQKVNQVFCLLFA